MIVRSRPAGFGRPSLAALMGGRQSEIALGAMLTEEGAARGYDDLGRALLNSGVYDWALEEMPRYGIKRVEDRHAAKMALLIHNQMRHGVPANDSSAFGIESLATEDIQTGDLALPTKWALPIIRRIYPAIFDSPLFATQTMPGPLAYAFYLDFLREVDGTDFRAVNPFTAFLSGTVAVNATTATLKLSANAGAIGYGPYQVVAGQKITVGVGTANVETLTVQSFAPSTGTVTFTGTGATKTHAIGDQVYVAPISSLGEAAIPTRGKLSLTRTQVQASKYMLAATWSTEAMEDARAQLNLDVEGEMVMALSVEVGRELFGIIINDILTGATGGTATLPAKGGSAVQDYRYLESQPLFGAEAQIYARRNHDCDTILAGLDVAQFLTQQDNFHITPADAQSTLASFGVTHLGTFQNKFSVYKTNFLPPNLAIMFNQPKDWLHAGYVFMPYIPLSPMPLVYAGYSTASGNYQNTDEWTRNIRMRAGKLLTVSDEYAIITQG